MVAMGHGNQRKFWILRCKTSKSLKNRALLRGGMVGEADAYLLPQRCTTFLGASPSEMGEEGPRCPALWGAAGTHVTVDAACQDLVHCHWPSSFQRVWHFGSLPGPTQLPRWLQLAFEGALSSGLGMLISAVPHCAPPTTPRSYHQWPWPICPIRGASLKATEMGPQS